MRLHSLAAWRPSVLGATCLAWSVAAGCASAPVRTVPPPPVTPIEVIEELDSGACPLTYDYLDLEVEGYFEAVRAVRGDPRLGAEPRSCWPRTWSEFAAWLLSLECPR